MKTAHDTDLYMLGKGILKFDRFDVDGLPTGLRDLGNCTDFTITVNSPTLKHYTSREGVKKLDLEVPSVQELAGKFVLDEFDAENIRLFLYGETGGWDISMLSVSSIVGELDFVGMNEVGPRYHVQVWKARLIPSGDLAMIGDDWGKMEFSFSVQADTVGHPDSPYGLVTPLGES